MDEYNEEEIITKCFNAITDCCNAFRIALDIMEQERDRMQIVRAQFEERLKTLWNKEGSE